MRNLFAKVFIIKGNFLLKNVRMIAIDHTDIVGGIIYEKNTS